MKILTWRDVTSRFETWRHDANNMSLISGCRRARSMNFFCFTGLSSQGTQCNMSQHCNLDAWPCTSRGHLTLYGFVPISGSRQATAMNFFCFHGFSDQEIQCNISQRCSLDTWPCTWPWMRPFLSLTVDKLHRWTFLFPWFFGLGNSTQHKPSLQLLHVTLNGSMHNSHCSNILLYVS